MKKINTEESLSPIIKWAGGKEQELKYILPNIPQDFTRFIEPFVGGGAVYFSIKNKKMIVNDKSTELINLYTDLKYHNELFVKKIQNLQKAWLNIEKFLSKNLDFFKNIYEAYKNSIIDDEKLKQNLNTFLIKSKKTLRKIVNFENIDAYDIFFKELQRNIYSKLSRMKVLEIEKGNLIDTDICDNFECALKSSFYMFIRTLYNKDVIKKSEYFYFIREYCYSSMFRYNSNGEFNVPYGGISYNHKNFQRKIDYIKSNSLRKHLSNTKFYNLDFENFLNKIKITSTDFLFFDPPYDSNFSSYTNNSFGQQDQIRLSQYLIKKCVGKFMLVIKNTKFISSLYLDGTICKNKQPLKIYNFDKKYMVSFKNRNNRNSEHLLIKNY